MDSLICWPSGRYVWFPLEVFQRLGPAGLDLSSASRLLIVPHKCPHKPRAMH